MGQSHDRPIVSYQKLSIIKVDLFIQNYPENFFSEISRLFLTWQIELKNLILVSTPHSPISKLP